MISVKCKLLSLTFSNITSKENPHRCNQRAKGQHETNEQPNASTLKEITFYQNCFSYGRSQFNYFSKKKKKKPNRKKYVFAMKV